MLIDCTIFDQIKEKLNIDNGNPKTNPVEIKKIDSLINNPRIFFFGVPRIVNIYRTEGAQIIINQIIDTIRETGEVIIPMIGEDGQEYRLVLIQKW